MGYTRMVLKIFLTRNFLGPQREIEDLQKTVGSSIGKSAGPVDNNSQSHESGAQITDQQMDIDEDAILIDLR
jgi:hypothetical protein